MSENIVKSLWVKARDKTINSIADAMVEHPNMAFAFLIIQTLVLLTLMVGSGVDSSTLN